MKAGVMGSPISHSLSPFIFEFISKDQNHPIDYRTFEVTNKEGKAFLNSKINDDLFLGLNVTLPLKELFLEDIHYISKEVKSIGALNLLHFKEQKIYGYNTDIVGILKTFEDHKFQIAENNCFILGAGGSAKAVAYVLGTLKAKNVMIFSRSKKGDELVNQFSLLFPHTTWSSTQQIADETLQKYQIDLIVNTIPLGMSGKDSGVEFFETLRVLNFNKKSLAFDLIYTPEHTSFLDVADSLGLKTVGGLGMLIDQAIAGWKIWIGDLKNEKELHQKLKNVLKGILKIEFDHKPIFLTGFMGVGKSTVGLELSMLLKRQFIDVDKLIEAKALLTIPKIFAEKGEVYFRGLEKEIILELANTPDIIVALGGGSLIDDISFKKIYDTGHLVYLTALENTLVQRITNGEQGHSQERPILANLTLSEKKQKIMELFNLRKSRYQKAMIHIQTDHLNVRNVVYEIVSAFGKIKKDKSRGEK